MTIRYLGEIFLLAVLLVALYFTFVVLRPFASVIFIAAVLATLFYPVYQKLLKKVKKPSLASIIVCALVVAIIIIPVTNFAVLLTKKSIEAYNYIELQIKSGALESNSVRVQYELILNKVQTFLPFVKLDDFDFRQYILSLSDEIRGFLVSSTTGVIRGTTQVLTDFLLVILAMYYFFKEGPRWLTKLMQLTPLSNRYDQVLFKKFREVSVSSVVVTIAVAVVQGALGGLAFFLIGIPAFFLAIVMAFLSLVPVVGTALVWLPTSIVLISLGEVGKGVFLFLYGALIIATSDNLLRAWLIKGKAQVHPLFVFLSILGGIAVFGFWGIIYGPLILALTLTLLHIYELEYGQALEK